MNMKRRYRTLTKAVIIPSGFFVRILRSFIPSERSIVWAIPQQDRKWITDRMNQAGSESGLSFYYGNEKSLISLIKEKTQLHNRNNITKPFRGSLGIACAHGVQECRISDDGFKGRISDKAPE
ncbi:hypothetical protein M1K46_16535 [Fictibacillus sp. WQ 8-8]|uniref:hypothetical protein n=1 Tax=Fictibacillus sp. WQ 8-8 TaxID=2938788 RepID=UPI00210C8023|nr:hypothetical protein [Fictibacillus sp. WQ 8-8]MCQ6267245.1 hypothetical protein [Fictibacillus sp. WQ 8-8]